MFEDVAQMEKEIDTFRKNIVASSELVEGIAQLTEATKHQKEVFSASSDELIKKVDSCILQIKAEHEHALKALRDYIDSSIADMQNNTSADLKSKVAELDAIKTSIEKYQSQTTKKCDEQLQQLVIECERLIAEMKTELAAQQSAYAERLQHTEATIIEYQAKLGDSAEQVKADHEATLKALSDRIDTALADLQKNITADLDDEIEKIDKIKIAIEEYQTQITKKSDEQIQQLENECRRLITEMKTELAIQQSAYAEKLQHTELTIHGYQTTAEQKYNDFIRKLETTNVDQIYKEVQNLKKSVNAKFIVLMCGIGITLVVSIVGLILR